MKMASDFALELFLPFRLNRAAELVSLKFAAQYRREFSMTRPEWRVIAVLGSFGQTTAKHVCEVSTMHKTKVSRAVHALETRKWVHRQTDPEDRRSEHLALTPEGARNYQRLVAMARDYEAELAKVLGGKAHAHLVEGLSAVETEFGR
jgi:DNA-binding MarR family transcriptional regulator